MLSAAPLPVKIVLIAVLVVAFPFAIPTAFSILLVGALIYAPIALASGRRSVAASLSVAAWGIALVTAWSARQGTWMLALLVLPLLVAAAAHAGSLGRWFVPCRTVAWALLWALPVGLLASLLHTYQSVIGAALAYLIACIVLGWRLAKSWQDARHFGRQQAAPRARRAPTAGWRSRVTWSGPGIPRTARAASRPRRPRVIGRPRTGRRRSRLTRRWPSWTP